MNLFFYDTETTCFPNGQIHHNDPKQARVVQLGGMLTNHLGEELAVIDTIIKPEGWTIDERMADEKGRPTAFSIHGIGNEHANRVGVPLKVAMTMFSTLMAAADIRVAHNNEFDDRMIGLSALQSDVAGVGDLLMKQRVYCTMKASTNVCKILKANPRTSEDWKWPKLAEAYKHFTGRELIGAHATIHDLRGCKEVYFGLNPIAPAPAAA